MILHSKAECHSHRTHTPIFHKHAQSLFIHPAHARVHTHQEQQRMETQPCVHVTVDAAESSRDHSSTHPHTHHTLHIPHTHTIIIHFFFFSLLPHSPLSLHSLPIFALSFLHFQLVCWRVETDGTHPLSHAHSTLTYGWTHTPFTITPSCYSSFSPFTSLSSPSFYHSVVLLRQTDSTTHLIREQVSLSRHHWRSGSLPKFYTSDKGEKHGIERGHSVRTEKLSVVFSFWSTPTIKLRWLSWRNQRGVIRYGLYVSHSLISILDKRLRSSAST